MATQARVEPEQELSAQEIRDRMPVVGDGREELPYRDRAWICNITDLEWPPYYFEYGQFAIKACRPGEQFRMTTITARVSPMDHGDKNVTTVPVGALHIATDLVRIYNDNSGMGNAEAPPYVGLFVCETALPNEEQVEEAHAKLRAFCEHYCSIADSDWETYRKPAFIPGFARWAAKYLKVDKPYNISKGTQIECPACTANVSARAVICPNCKYVLKREKAAEMGLGEGNAPTLAAHEVTHEVATPQEHPKRPRSKTKSS